MKTNNKDKMIEEFWTALRSHPMWRDSESGRIEERITELLTETLTKHEEAVLKRIKHAFYEEFAGSGELWFPYSDGKKDKKYEYEAVDEYWESIIETLTTPDNPTSNNK